MANKDVMINFNRGKKADLPEQIKDGQILITTDTGQVYVDSEEGRVEIGGDIREQVESHNFGENNTTNLSETGTLTFAIGANNIVGAKIYSVASYTVTNTSTVVTLHEINDDFTESLVGQYVTMVIGHNTNAFGKVASIDIANKTVTIDTPREDENLELTLSSNSNTGITKTVNTDGSITYSGFSEDNEYFSDWLYFPYLEDADGNPKTIGTRSIGNMGTAIGSKNAAWSTAANAIGYENVADGKYAFVSGCGNKGGYASLVGGRNNEANGNYTLATGLGNKASGSYSQATGEANLASGKASMACGSFNKANGDYAQVSGFHTTASGFGAHATGESTVASGYGAYASGVSSVASGKGSAAIGISTHVTGEASFAGGYSSHANGNQSIAIGNQAKSQGDQSTAWGYLTTAKGARSYAGGESSTATGNRSFVHGATLTANNENCAVFGRYNDDTDTDNLFIVGNGTNTARSNAFEVKQTGNALAGGKAVVTSSDTTPMEIVASTTQPTPTEGKTIIWIDISALS